MGLHRQPPNTAHGERRQHEEKSDYPIKWHGRGPSEAEKRIKPNHPHLPIRGGRG